MPAAIPLPNQASLTNTNSVMNKPEIVNMQALLAEAIGGLPTHFNNGWVSIEEEEPNAATWLGEQVGDLEQQLIKAVQQRVIDAVTRNALVDLGLLKLEAE